MKLNAHYLKEIDTVTPEDFPEIRQLLLNRGVTHLELRYIPFNLRKHPLYQGFVRYCQYFDNLKKDEEFQEYLKKKQYKEIDRLEKQKIKEENDKRAYEKQKKKEERLLQAQKDKELKILKQQEELLLKERLKELNKKDKLLKKQLKNIKKKEERRLHHEELLKQHQLNKSNKGPKVLTGKRLERKIAYDIAEEKFKIFENCIDDEHILFEKEVILYNIAKNTENIDEVFDFLKRKFMA